MFNRIADGILGLFLFLSQWFSPGTNSDDLKLIYAKEYPDKYEIICAMKLVWNEQMSDIIDAGIPLRFKINARSNARDTITMIRTLSCDISTYNYSFYDTLLYPDNHNNLVSDNYKQMYRAVKDFCKFTVLFSREATTFQISVDLLPSYVSQLNRNIDVSDICNCRTFKLNLERKPKTDRKN